MFASCVKTLNSPNCASNALILASGARPKSRPAWKRLARPGFPGFWRGLPGKCGLVNPGKHGHSQAFLETLVTKAWPSWPCYFQGRTFSATLVKKAWPNPGLKDSSQAWPGFFKFPGHKFTTFSDCNVKPQNLWPFDKKFNKKSTKAVIYELYRPSMPFDYRQ